MKRKKVPIGQTVGLALAHDLTRIVPGKSKETAFKKNQIITAADLETLKDMGRASLYILELAPDEVHENDAAAQLARALGGEGVIASAPGEGKVNLTSTRRGLLQIQVKGTARLNAINHLALSTRHTNSVVEAGELLASFKVVPLAVKRSFLERAIALKEKFGPLVQVAEFKPLKVGAVVTGGEVLSGRVVDGFDQFVGPRITQYGAGIIDKQVVGDEVADIAGAIKAQVAAGAEMIVVTGGLSVDPDDRTRQGIRRAGARQVFYGSPVLPGAMFLYALMDSARGRIPVLGVPACVYYNHHTVFDMVLPRTLVGETMSRAKISALGHGGLCLLCDTCSYPHCPFGKGGVQPA